MRPQGRSERIRLSVARACLGLLAEGQTDLPHAEVAARCGVSRTTLYRWWPTTADLMREALALHTRSLATPDTGSWAGDVHALMTQLAAFLADPIERAQNAILASGRHPEFNALSTNYYEPIVATWHELVQRGIERGEVRPETNVSVAVRMMLAPLLAITLFERRAPLPREVAEYARLAIRATAVDPDAAERFDAARARAQSRARKARRRRSA